MPVGRGVAPIRGRRFGRTVVLWPTDQMAVGGEGREMVATNGTDRVSARVDWAREIAFWLRRYAPAEVAATLGAMLAAGAAGSFGGASAGALAGTAGEAVAFYGFLIIRGLRRRPERPLTGAAVLRTLHDLAVEFGPAEVLDTGLIRPMAMYLGIALLASVTSGTIAGKVAADLIFYVLASVSYRLLNSRRDAAVRLPSPEPIGMPAGHAQRCGRALVALGLRS